MEKCLYPYGENGYNRIGTSVGKLHGYLDPNKSRVLKAVFFSVNMKIRMCASVRAFIKHFFGNSHGAGIL